MLIRIPCVVVGFDDSVLFKKYKPAIPYNFYYEI